MNDPFHFPIILASSSPRRIELMKQVGLPVRILAPTAPEKRKAGESPRSMVARLARLKAESVANMALRENTAALIIGADTIVISPGGREVLGKPKTEQDAKRMLKKLAGKTHVVLSGYCIFWVSRGLPFKRIVRVISTQVKMRKLSLELIEGYIRTGEPMDKAGSYAAQGMGMALIERIGGSYTNVVGLPIAQLLSDLENEFGISPYSISRDIK